MRIATWAIAGLAVEVLSDDPEGFIGSPAFLEYETMPESSLPDIRIQWRRVARLTTISEACLAYDPGGIWRMYRNPNRDGWVADIRYEKQTPTARITIDDKWSDVEFREIPYPDEAFSPLCYGGLELLVRTRLLDCCGIVFHASGIDDSGSGIMFVGHSGAGKSTQADIWSTHSGAILINHDRMAVRMQDSGVTLHGLPWGGSAKITLNHSAPLKAIVLLEQSDRNSISPVPTLEAVAELISCTFLPYWDEERMEKAFSIIEELTARVPVLRLRCRPEPAVIELVRSALI